MDKEAKAVLSDVWMVKCCWNCEHNGQHIAEDDPFCNLRSVYTTNESCCKEHKRTPNGWQQFPEAGLKEGEKC